jgi:glycosyltransferase involved in cell wall biosynthesis
LIALARRGVTNRILAHVTDRPLVSIVTPTLNQGAFIDATIRSIRGQIYDHYEHIVIDGGSTDGTLDILRAHEGTYPMRWTSEPDRGMYDAINKGVRQARGEILCYLNSDDLYFPWTLETVVEYFDRHPDIDFVYGDALSIENPSGRLRPYWTPPFDLGYLRAVGFLAQPTVFWRRRAYECEGGFDEALRYVADCDYWMRAGDHHRFAKINEFLAVERDHPGTQRLALGSRVWDELADVRSRYASSSARSGSHWLRRALWHRFYSLALAVALRRGGHPRGAWARLVRTRTVRFSAWRLVLGLLPRVGHRLAGEVYGRDEWWIAGRRSKDGPRPTFSVIVAAMNAAETINDTIDSVEAQSERSRELIVMDGGSTDGTVETLRRRADVLAHWESSPDRGIGHAWNKALAMAEGEWILFLGADDRLASPDVLERAASMLPSPTTSRLAYGQVDVVDRSGRVLSTSGLPWDQIQKRQRHVNLMPHQAVFHHRSLFAVQGPFDESYRISSDYELLLRELRRSPAVFMPGLTVAHMRDGGVSRQPESMFAATVEQHRARRSNGLARVPAMISPRIIRARAYHLVSSRLGERRARSWADRWHRRPVATGETGGPDDHQ